MKKKIIIPIIVCLVIVIGIIGFIIWNNRTVSTITLDINPSVEINLYKREKVKSVVALNDDAKDILDDNYKGKSLDDSFEILISNLIEKGYVDNENNLDVILHVDGKITNKMVSEQIEYEFGKKGIHTEIVIIESVTKEDEELAKKYNVSPAKIAYVKSIIQDNDNITLENIVNDSVSELKETKETGKYCDEGYTLEGDFCLKEIKRVSASKGEVCPRNYLEYEGKCYEEVGAIETNNYVCNDGFKLINNNCVSEEIDDARGKCDSGDYDPVSGYCIKKELIGEAEEYCRLTPATDILMNHKCYGPKPTINGSCLNGDRLINGGCVDMSSYYESDYRCKTGDLENDNKCYKEVKTKPTSYYCERDGILNGTKCEVKYTQKPQKERTCPSGYTSIDDGSRCLNYNKTVNKENGYYCEQENSKLSGKTCIIYEMVEAKNN